MKKKSAEKPSANEQPDQTSCELFVFGDDEEKKEFRGGRFAHATDQLITAAKDHGYQAVVKPPVLFAKLAMDLPLGKAFSDGKVTFQPLAKALYRKLVEAEKLIPQYRDLEASDVPIEYFNNDEPLPDTEKVAPLPTYPTLPRDWGTIDVNDLVLITAGAEYGWWESIVIKREQEILFLRLRDEPKNGVFVRHRQGVALINPGPQTDQNRTAP